MIYTSMSHYDEAADALLQAAGSNNFPPAMLAAAVRFFARPQRKPTRRKAFPA